MEEPKKSIDLTRLDAEAAIARVNSAARREIATINSAAKASIARIASAANATLRQIVPTKSDAAN